MQLHELKYSNFLIIGFSFIFIFINSFIIYNYGLIYFSFFPFALLLGAILLKAYDKIFFLIAFFTPLSLSLSFFIPEIEFNLSLFTEPLLVILMIILGVKFFLNRKIETSIVRHPITIAIFLYLGWMFITTISSTMPGVSFKFFVSKLWFIIPSFFFGIILFKKYKNIKFFIWAYSISLFIVVIISTIKLSQTSFLSSNAAHFVPKPFYNDHTAYGAIVTFFAPVLWGFTFKSRYKPQIKIIAGFFAVAFTIAIVLSYSRASWIGIVLALGAWAATKLKIKFRYILTVIALLAVFLSTFWFQIIDKLDKNKQDSSSSISHHIESITNISTDASNVERLNRWRCAIEMFKEKPIVGWGPGTYQFQYAPFQLERMRTIISTNFGNIGNSHSEYLGPLAEEGGLGMITFIGMALSILLTGFRIHKFAADKEIKMLSLSITLAFLTYFIHGFLNNFLDTDKLAIPFFGFAAILVALDIYHKSKQSAVGSPL